MRRERDAGTPLFRELRGGYEHGAGQVVNLREYLDYFEPLGTALTRLPDGAGGPFVYQFSGSGGRVIGAIGWVVNASSTRYGAWKLWGLWADRPIPALTLPLLWPELSDPSRLPKLLERANAHADRLLRDDVFDDLKTKYLHDERFRTLLKTHLTRAYRATDVRTRPIEVEVTRDTLDLLPWLVLLGPVAPEAAQLQPNRFNGSGYQYILTESPQTSGEIAAEVGEMVDVAVNDVLEGWNMAAALRERRTRPRIVEAARHRPAAEVSEMRTKPTRSRLWPPEAIWRAVCDVAVIALLAWIAWNVQAIRKHFETPATNTVQIAAPEPTRAERIAHALATHPPQGIKLAPALLASTPSNETLERVAVEIFLRRNGCFPRTEIVDGRLSANEQKAMRNCAPLTRERLLAGELEPHPERALAWLENAL